MNWIKMGNGWQSIVYISWHVVCIEILMGIICPEERLILSLFLLLVELQGHSAHLRRQFNCFCSMPYIWLDLMLGKYDVCSCWAIHLGFALPMSVRTCNFTSQYFLLTIWNDITSKRVIIIRSAILIINLNKNGTPSFNSLHKNFELLV